MDALRVEGLRCRRRGFRKSVDCFSVFALLLTVSPCGAGGVPAGPGKEVCQLAVLRKGFTIEYAQREVAGQTTRLWLCAEAGVGYVEIPSDQIEGFEQKQNPELPAPVSTPETTPRGMFAAGDFIKNLIASAASRHQLDPDLVASMVKAESGFIPTAVSPKGAGGLMQLMPRTAASLGVEDVLDPVANVEGGAKYLRQLLDRYDGDWVKALAAYNAGPQRVAQYGGIPPYRETRAYVARVIDDYNRKKLQQQAHSTATPSDK